MVQINPNFLLKRAVFFYLTNFMHVFCCFFCKNPYLRSVFMTKLIFIY